jgi:hypothetical protein
MTTVASMNASDEPRIVAALRIENSVLNVARAVQGDPATQPSF